MPALLERDARRSFDRCAVRANHDRVHPVDVLRPRQLGRQLELGMPASGSLYMRRDTPLFAMTQSIRASCATPIAACMPVMRKL